MPGFAGLQPSLPCSAGPERSSAFLASPSQAGACCHHYRRGRPNTPGSSSGQRPV